MKLTDFTSMLKEFKASQIYQRKSGNEVLKTILDSN